MSPNKRLKRLLLPIGAALAAGGTVLLGVAPTSVAAPAAQDSDAQAVTLNLVDRLAKWYPNEQVTNPRDVPVGFMTVWFGKVQDADNPSKTAGANGTLDIVAKDPSTGAATAYMSETIQFPDGAIRYFGLYNRTTAIAQKWITMSAAGVSGRYAGMTGKVHWRISSVTDPSIPVEEHVDLHGFKPRS